jgi:hypothetical protein
LGKERVAPADYRDVSVSEVLARVAQIQQLASGAPAAQPPALSVPTGQSGFAPLLASAIASPAAGGPGNTLPSTLLSLQPVLAPQTAASSGASAGARALAFAEAEVGQSERPPGSNDSPRIADYRSAVAGSYAGAPWCAYFVSWAAAMAGAPLGENGQGYGAVEQIHDWAQRTGRLLPAGAVPQPGDLILFGGRHVGIVESVNGDGSLTTIEGNHASAVSRVQRSPAEATGYVRL